MIVAANSKTPKIIKTAAATVVPQPFDGLLP